MSRVPTDQDLSIDAILRKATESKVSSARLAAQHLIEAGGKRVRPHFALLLGRLLEGPPEIAQIIGTAAELVHTATLLHDDVIDQSDLRRGTPAVHTRYGVVNAVLAGDFLLATALQALTSRQLFAATHELTVAVRELVEAELLQSERAFSTRTTSEESKYIAEGKTGALFAWCARAVAMSLERPEEHTREADRLGRLVGYAFQVADDLLDIAEYDTGKPGYKDLREGQLTVPIQMARAVDRQLDADITKAFATRRDADFAAAYRSLEQSRARELGQEELQRCREGILRIWKRIDDNPDTAVDLLAFYDGLRGPA